MSETYSLTVNGKDEIVSAPPDTPLIYVLRNQLGLKGVRYGCGLEQCGCCTVLVDGAPAFACSQAVETAAGASIETIEGLGAREAPHPLQQAFMDLQAGQCGYCLAGILMAAKALLAENSDPSRADIIAALDGHLCRCGAHNRIIAAIQQAAKAMGGAS
jgi:nicotinate dehydrogenase subunit A